MAEEILIGIIGYGTIGTGVVSIYQSQREFFKSKLGIAIHLKRVVDIKEDVLQPLAQTDILFSTNIHDILNDSDIDIVIELVGGIAVAKDIILHALNSGKHVVTANKALLAEYGDEIFLLAEKKNVSVFFEAAVGGGMPIIKSARESMIANEIISVTTIINGTCNYILSSMSEKGLSFEEALWGAQENGFAESDPTLDIQGFDAAHKMAILGSLFYGGYVTYKNIFREGIVSITPLDIEYAKQLGYTIKLLGIIKKNSSDNDCVEIRVHPTMIHMNHILASVAREYNAVLIEGDAVGKIVLYGKGAGKMPTASAVVSDIIDIARNMLSSNTKRIPMDFYTKHNTICLKPMGDVLSRYYLRFSVVDQPGVLAALCTILGKRNISIASVIQKEEHPEAFAQVIMLTHISMESDVQKAIEEIERLTYIKLKTQCIRIED